MQQMMIYSATRFAITGAGISSQQFRVDKTSNDHGKDQGRHTQTHKENYDHTKHLTRISVLLLLLW